MDIKDILDSLGLDLANPETRRGAIEAIQAILNSRMPSPDMSGMPMPKGDIDVEIDPDLLQPSQKHNPSKSDDDIEIEDEEDILSQIKRNDAEDEPDDNGNSEGNNSSNDSESDSTSNGDSAASDNSSEDNQSSNNNEDTSNSNAEGDSSQSSSDEPNEESTQTEDDTIEAAEDSMTGAEETSEEEDTESSLEQADETEEPEESNSEDEETDELDFENEEEPEDTDHDDFEFDEDDFLDNELKNEYDDQELKSKHEARKIKRERTLAAAKKALADAQARNVAPNLIRELEKSIEALESLVEAAQKNIKDLSDDEFNLMINRVFDAISAVGDKELTFTTDEERELRAQEIKTDLGSRETQQALSDEDIAAIRAETQAVKAREKETAVYRRPAASSFKGFKEFLNSLYRAIALQVQTNEIQDDTWSAINRRYSGTGVLKQGQRKNDLPDKKIPVIDFYFDQSGSWNEQDIAAGKKAVEALVDMEEKGQIKINIYYFSNHVFNDAASARAEGGTEAWNDIVKNVIATQATNVVIMTDSDMEDWWSGPEALKYTVPGYVWYLWRNGVNAPRLPRDLRGRGGVQQFSFNRGDA